MPTRSAWLVDVGLSLRLQVHVVSLPLGIIFADNNLRTISCMSLAEGNVTPLPSTNSPFASIRRHLKYKCACWKGFYDCRTCYARWECHLCPSEWLFEPAEQSLERPKRARRRRETTTTVASLLSHFYSPFDNTFNTQKWHRSTQSTLCKRVDVQTSTLVL